MKTQLQFNKNLTDSILIFYDDVIEYYDLKIMKFLLKNFNNFNQFLNLDKIKNNDWDHIKLLLLERNNRNILDWLGRNCDENTDATMNDLYNNIDSIYKYPEYTDFAFKLLKLAITTDIKKVSIIINTKDKIKVKNCRNLFSQILDKISMINPDELNTLDLSGYKAIISNDDFFLKSLSDGSIKYNGCLLIPFVGYNFKLFANEDFENKIPISSYELEKIDSIEFANFKPFNITKQMFNVG